MNKLEEIKAKILKRYPDADVDWDEEADSIRLYINIEDYSNQNLDDDLDYFDSAIYDAGFDSIEDCAWDLDDGWSEDDDLQGIIYFNYIFSSLKKPIQSGYANYPITKKIIKELESDPSVDPEQYSAILKEVEKHFSKVASSKNCEEKEEETEIIESSVNQGETKDIVAECWEKALTKVGALNVLATHGYNKTDFGVNPAEDFSYECYIMDKGQFAGSLTEVFTQLLNDAGLNVEVSTEQDSMSTIRIVKVLDEIKSSVEVTSELDEYSVMMIDNPGNKDMTMAEAFYKAHGDYTTFVKILEGKVDATDEELKDFWDDYTADMQYDSDFAYA